VGFFTDDVGNLADKGENEDDDAVAAALIPEEEKAAFHT
jgi:hypothetical protein